MSTGSAGSYGVSGGYSFGGGIVVGSGIGACCLSGSQVGLFIMSFDKSVINSIIMHHSAGLCAAPNVSLRYIRAHIDVMQIHCAAVEACVCILLYAASRSNLHNRIGKLGNESLIACIMWMRRRNMNP